MNYGDMFIQMYPFTFSTRASIVKNVISNLIDNRPLKLLSRTYQDLYRWSRHAVRPSLYCCRTSVEDVDIDPYTPALFHCHIVGSVLCLLFFLLISVVLNVLKQRRTVLLILMPISISYDNMVDEFVLNVSKYVFSIKIMIDFGFVNTIHWKEYLIDIVLYMILLEAIISI